MLLFVHLLLSSVTTIECVVLKNGNLLKSFEAWSFSMSFIKYFNKRFTTHLKQNSSQYLKNALQNVQCHIQVSSVSATLYLALAGSTDAHLRMF